MRNSIKISAGILLGLTICAVLFSLNVQPKIFVTYSDKLQQSPRICAQDFMYNFAAKKLLLASQSYGCSDAKPAPNFTRDNLSVRGGPLNRYQNDLIAALNFDLEDIFGMDVFYQPGPINLLNTSKKTNVLIFDRRDNLELNRFTSSEFNEDLYQFDKDGYEYPEESIDVISIAHLISKESIQQDVCVIRHVFSRHTDQTVNSINIHVYVGYENHSELIEDNIIGWPYWECISSAYYILSQNGNLGEVNLNVDTSKFATFNSTESGLDR